MGYLTGARGSLLSKSTGDGAALEPKLQMVSWPLQQYIKTASSERSESAKTKLPVLLTLSEDNEEAAEVDTVDSTFDISSRALRLE